MKTISIPLRYILLLALTLSTPIIYKLLTPVTIYPSYLILKILFNQVTLIQNLIIINSETLIEIIPACISASAYLLLLILNLTTSITLKTRIQSLIFSLTLLLILNILRISILAILLVNNFTYFNLTHKILWLFLSTILVIFIWFLTIKIFKIKSIPVYSDLSKLFNGV